MSFDEQVVANIVKQVLSRVDMGGAQPSCAAAGGDWGVFESMDDAVEAANDIASEHMEILTKDPFQTMTKVKNAGAIFLGEYSSEPLGDYFAGPNHILPTNGTAKFFSPLGVDDFIKKTSIISYSREALLRDHEDIERFAKSEGLTAHANSVAVRFQ